MEQPEGFEKRGANLVCKLNKTLYGTKQAPNEWNTELSDFIISLGFKRCLSDTCLYVKQSKKGNTMMIGIFVDDTLTAYATDDEQEWQEYKTKFMSQYKMKDLGNAEWILGMRIIRNRKERTLHIDQTVYISKLLQKFRMTNSKPLSTPADSSQRLSKTHSPTTEVEREQMRNIPYRQLIGGLLYASTSTRPDISQAVNTLSSYMQNPGPAHWTAAKRVLRYLKNTKALGLTYNGKNQDRITVNAYADADYGGDLDDRRSTSGYVIRINDCAVSWSSKKQPTVALSTAEAEYMAISYAVQEVKWITQVLAELNYKQKEPVILYSDNQAAIAISENDVNHSRSKHIDIRHHYVRETIKQKLIKMEWVATAEQIADIHTKPLGGTIFKELRDKVMGKRQ
jgi:ribonuclease HI